MKRIFVTAALAASSLFAVSANAQSADALICYSSIFSQPSSTSGTVNYPQLTNATKYTCNSTTQYTLSQLAKGGWIVVSIEDTPYSATFNSNGTTTSNNRYRLLLRMPSLQE